MNMMTHDGYETLVAKDADALTLDDNVLTGIDLIEWRDGRIKQLRADLDV